jgi:hypothetical protein
VALWDKEPEMRAGRRHLDPLVLRVADLDEEKVDEAPKGAGNPAKFRYTPPARGAP